MNSSRSNITHATALDLSQQHPRTALVLGGGGSTGNAWLIGVVAGLFEAGLDVTAADLIVGTSAGSTAAAQITGASPTRLLADILDSAPPHAPAGPAGTSGGRASATSVIEHMERTRRIIEAAEGPADLRRRMGAAAIALAAASDESVQERWRATVASRLPSGSWPGQRILITAVDAGTGEPVVFDRSSGVDLADAVAASCSSGSAYRIGRAQYIDGGYRSNAENADLAAGCARVLVLSPFSGRTRTPMAWGLHLETQIAELHARGSGVETIFPGDDLEHLFGPAGMNPALRPPAARAGHDQGVALAPRLTEFWS
ncbi:patatin-like phospholipase family protein [Agromyces sp. PvR057]|uniref:patatin-like phospholipase family protein n=1 Tax=Agromyces sp. PvR057 TaxID=3156403 RepID=UPI000E23731E